jgi:hypothetical protein
MSAWTKVTAKTAADVCKLFPLSDEAKPLLKDGLAPKAFFDQLVEKGHTIDAIRFLGCALPKREAVWWAVVVGRQAYAPGAPPPKVAAALNAAEKWVTEPKEETRRAAQKAGEEAEYGTPGGCAATAAFFSGGSISLPGLPEVPAQEHHCGHFAACAVMLAAVVKEPEKALDKHKAYLKVGGEVAAGTNKWKGA